MIVLRAMTQEDVSGVMEIEETVCEFPWTASIFSDCIKVGYSCFVHADSETNEVLGYGLLSVAANEAHILNLCVKPKVQHQGLGRKMMLHLIETSKRLGAKSVYLEVRVSNYKAISLYRQLKFIQIGERKEYYPAKDGREDAMVFSMSFGELLETHEDRFQR